MSGYYGDYAEASELPPQCHGCMEDCYNCDCAGDRWPISQRKQLELKRALKIKAISRFQRELAEIDLQLAVLNADAAGARSDGHSC